MLTRKIMIFISISLYVGVFTPAPTYLSTIKAFAIENTEEKRDSSALPQNDNAIYGVLQMKDIERKYSDTEIGIFTNVIKPYLIGFFKDNGIKEFDDGDTVYQQLRGIRLQRVDDGDKFLVHIEFLGLTVNNMTGDYIGGLKGQEILFLIKDGELKDFQDLSIYYLETPRMGVVNRKGA